jgi:hypothetical protein
VIRSARRALPLHVREVVLVHTPTRVTMTVPLSGTISPSAA